MRSTSTGTRTTPIPRGTWSLLNGEPVGRLYVARWPDDIRVVDIALMPEHRGGGLGTRLLREILAEGDASGRKVSIHVEIYNPARQPVRAAGIRAGGGEGACTC